MLIMAEQHGLRHHSLKSLSKVLICKYCRHKCVDVLRYLNHLRSHELWLIPYWYVKRPFVIDDWLESINKKKNALSGKQHLDSRGQTDISSFDVDQSTFNLCDLNQHGDGDDEQQVTAGCFEDNQTVSRKSSKNLCRYCGKVFRAKGVLKKHLKIHKIDIDHDLSTCNKSKKSIHSASRFESMPRDYSDVSNSEDDFDNTKINNPACSVNASDSDSDDKSLVNGFKKSPEKSTSSGFDGLAAKNVNPEVRQPSVISDTSDSEVKKVHANASKHSTKRRSIVVDSSSASEDIAGKGSKTPVLKSAHILPSDASDFDGVVRVVQKITAAPPTSDKFSEEDLVGDEISKTKETRQISDASDSKDDRNDVVSKTPTARSTHALVVTDLSDSGGLFAKIHKAAATSVKSHTSRLNGDDIATNISKAKPVKHNLFSDTSDSKDIVSNSPKAPVVRPAGANILSDSDVDRPSGANILSDSDVDQPSGANILSDSDVDRPSGANILSDSDVYRPSGANILSDSDVDRPSGANILSDSDVDRPSGANILSDSDVDQPSGANILSDSDVYRPSGANILSDSDVYRTSGANILSDSDVDQPSGANILSDSDVDRPSGANILSDSDVDQPSGANILSDSDVDRPSGANILSDSDVDRPSGANILSDSDVDRPSGASILSDSDVDQSSGANILSDSDVDRPSGANILSDSDVDQPSGANILSDSDVDRPSGANILSDSDVDRPSGANILSDSDDNYVDVVTSIPAASLGPYSDFSDSGESDHVGSVPSKAPSGGHAIPSDSSCSDNELSVNTSKTSLIASDLVSNDVQTPRARSPIFNKTFDSGEPNIGKEYSRLQEKADRVKSTAINSSPVKKHQCGYCDDTFVDRTCLKNHMKVHFSEVMSDDSNSPSRNRLPSSVDRNFRSCVYCGEKFMALESLKAHVTMHLDMLKKTNESTNQVEKADDDNLIFVSERNSKDQDGIDLTEDTDVNHPGKTGERVRQRLEASLSRKGPSSSKNRSKSIHNGNDYKASRNSSFQAETFVADSISSNNCATFRKEHSETEQSLSAEDTSAIENACKKLHPATPSKKSDVSIKESLKAQKYKDGSMKEWKSQVSRTTSVKETDSSRVVGWKSQVSRTTQDKETVSSRVVGKSNHKQHSEERCKQNHGSSAPEGKVISKPKKLHPPKYPGKEGCITLKKKELTPEKKKESFSGKSNDSSATKQGLISVPKKLYPVNTPSSKSDDKIPLKTIKGKKLSSGKGKESLSGKSNDSSAPKHGLILVPKKLYPVNIPLSKSDDGEPLKTSKRNKLSSGKGAESLSGKSNDSSAPKHGLISVPKKLYPVNTPSSKSDDKMPLKTIKGNKLSSGKRAESLSGKSNDSSAPKHGLISVPKKLYPVNIPLSKSDDGAPLKTSKGNQLSSGKGAESLSGKSNDSSATKQGLISVPKKLYPVNTPSSKSDDKIPLKTIKGKKLSSGKGKESLSGKSNDSSAPKHGLILVPKKLYPVNIPLSKSDDEEPLTTSKGNKLSSEKGAESLSGKSNDSSATKQGLISVPKKLYPVNTPSSKSDDKMPLKTMKGNKSSSRKRAESLSGKSNDSSVTKHGLISVPKKLYPVNTPSSKSDAEKLLKTIKGKKSSSGEGEESSPKKSYIQMPKALPLEKLQMQTMPSHDENVKREKQCKKLHPPSMMKTQNIPRYSEGKQDIPSLSSPSMGCERSKTFVESDDTQKDTVHQNFNRKKEKQAESLKHNIDLSTRNKKSAKQDETKLKVTTEVIGHVEIASRSSVNKLPTKRKADPFDMKVKHKDENSGFNQKTHKLAEIGNIDLKRIKYQKKPILEDNDKIRGVQPQQKLNKPTSQKKLWTSKMKQKMNFLLEKSSGKKILKSEVNNNASKIPASIGCVLDQQNAEQISKTLEQDKDSTRNSKPLDNSRADESNVSSKCKDSRIKEVAEDLKEPCDITVLERREEFSDSDVDVDVNEYALSPLQVVDEILICSNCNEEFSTSNSYHIHRMMCCEKHEIVTQSENSEEEQNHGVGEKLVHINHETSKKFLKRNLLNANQYHDQSINAKVKRKGKNSKTQMQLHKRSVSSDKSMTESPIKRGTISKLAKISKSARSYHEELASMELDVAETIEDTKTERPKKLHNKSVADSSVNGSPMRRKATSEQTKTSECSNHEETCQEPPTAGGLSLSHMLEQKNDEERSSDREGIVPKRVKKSDVKLKRQLEHIMSIKSLFKPDSYGLIKKSNDLGIINKVEDSRETQDNTQRSSSHVIRNRQDKKSQGADHRRLEMKEFHKCDEKFPTNSAYKDRKKSCSKKSHDEKKQGVDKERVEAKECQKCEEKFPTRSAYEYHKKTCCGMSQKQSSNEPEKELKSIKFKSDSKETCKCENCKMSFKDVQALRDHERSCVAKEDKPSVNHGESAWQDSEDSKETLNETKHIDTKDMKARCNCKRCAHCHSEENDKDVSSDEQKKIRDRRGIFVCPVADCKKLLRYKQSLQIHLETHKSIRDLYNCDKCDKMFLYERSLKDHKLSHTGHQFKCGECGMGFLNRRSLANHQEKGHEDVGVDQFTCDRPGCGQVFKERPFLKIHQYLIHIKKKFKCKKCYVVFSSRDKLATHVKSKECELVQHNCKLKNCANCNPRLEVSADTTGIEKGNGKEKPKEMGKDERERETRKRKENFKVDTNKVPTKGTFEKDARKETSGRELGKQMLKTEKLRQESRKEKLTTKPISNPLKNTTGSLNLFICLICKKAFISQTYLDLHQKKHGRQKQVFKCHVCDKRFRYRSNFLEHKLIHAGHKFMCGECGKEFTSRPGLSQHQKAGHALPIPPDTSKPHFGEVNLKCTFPGCRQVFKSKIELTHHKIKEHEKGKIYKCGECSQQFVSKKSLIAHRDLHDDKSKPYKCSTCGLRFQHQATLYSHKYRFHRRASGMEKEVAMYSVPAEFHNKIKVVKKEDGTVKYQCKLCKKKYPTLRQFTVHAQVAHMGKDIFRCRFCLKKFPSRSLCASHEVVHESVKVKKFKCQYCSKPFNKKAHVQAHELIHTGEKKHACHLCDYKCISGGNLRIHLRTHTKEKPYKCSYPDCTMAFSGLSNCKRHERSTHTDIRPHKCEICAKAFKSVGELRKHMETHSDAMNYTCKLCDKKFKASSSFSLHMKKHTGLKTHKCTYCKKRFYTAYELRSHMRLHTGERPYKCRHCSDRFKSSSNRSEHEKGIHLGIKRIYRKTKE